VPPTHSFTYPPTCLPADAITALRKQFGKWHGISSLINLAGMVVGEWVGGAHYAANKTSLLVAFRT